jgi:hypothetical protein
MFSSVPRPKYQLGEQVQVEGVSQPIPANGQMAITFAPGTAMVRIHEGHVIIREAREAPVRGILIKWCEAGILKQLCFSTWGEGTPPNIFPIPNGTYYWVGMVDAIWVPESEVSNA